MTDEIPPRDDRTADDYPAYIDKRDAEVVKRLEVGKKYSVATIQRAYKQYTDITREQTAKERKGALVKTPCFENTGIGIFRFVGFDDDVEVLESHD